MAMLICPYCGEAIPKRAFACRSCKRMLVYLHSGAGSRSPHKTVKVTAFPQEKIPQDGAAGHPAENLTSDSFALDPQLSEPLASNEIALFIGSHNLPIRLTLSPLAILGRYAEGSSDQPHLDLVPYGAYELGVSRFHACLRYENNIFEIEDLGSSNGTWLNERRLNAHKPTALVHGDRVRLGQISLRVMFIEAAAGSAPKRQGENDAEV